MKNQLRLKLLDLNIPLHVFLFATCRISSRSNCGVTGFSRVVFLAWGPVTRGLLVFVSLGLAFHWTLFSLPAESKGSGGFFHTDQKFCFRKTFCICRAEKYILSQLQTIFNIKFKKRMDISQVYLNFKDFFRKVRFCKHFLLVIFPISAVKRYILLALRTEMIKRHNWYKCLFCRIHPSLTYISLAWIYLYLWFGFHLKLCLRSRLGVRWKATKWQINIYFKQYYSGF